MDSPCKRLGEKVARENLTATRIGAFTCPAGRAQAFLWDTAMAGLALRATPAGAKAFIFQTVCAGKSLRMTIGQPCDWTIPEVRKEARRLQTIVDKGGDPRAAKAATVAKDQTDRAAAKSERQRQQVTGLDAWAIYCTERAPKWSPRHAKNHATMVQAGGEARTRAKASTTQPGVLYRLLALPLAQIGTDAIGPWLKAETATRPAVAALAFRQLAAFLRWCGEHDEFGAIAQADAHKPRRIRELVAAGGTKDDCLQREQLPLWFDAVRQISSPVISAFLQAALLTGARREELAGLRWDDVDFRWLSLSIADKVEGARVIPLTPYVAHLLAGLPRRNKWVFSSAAAADGRLQEPRYAHMKALAVAGLPHLTIHGLRRSFGTLCEWVEMPAGVVAQVMGHKPSATAEKHYKRRPLDLLRQWHTKAEVWMLEQAGVTFDATAAPGALRVVAAQQ